MDVDWGFWSFCIALAFPLLAVVFRKRIGRYIGRQIMAALPETIDRYLWEEVEEVVEAGPGGGVAKKIRVKHLRKEALDQFKGLAPVLATEALKGISVKLPKNLPINPQTGQIDMMAPLLMRIAEGKKINLMDMVTPFLPRLIELISSFAPKIQEVVGNLGGGKTSGGGPLSPTASDIVKKALTP